MTKKRKKCGLGSQGTVDYTQRARDWFSSAVDNFTRIRRGKQRGCSAVEHYTDVVAEATAAEAMAHESGAHTLAKQANKLRKTATQAQRGAVALCRRG